MLHPDMKWVRPWLLELYLDVQHIFALLHSSVAVLCIIKDVPVSARCEHRLCAWAAWVLPRVCMQWQIARLPPLWAHDVTHSSLCGAGPGAGTGAALHRALQEVGPDSCCCRRLCPCSKQPRTS